MEHLFSTFLPAVFLPLYLGSFASSFGLGYVVGERSFGVRLFVFAIFSVLVCIGSLLILREILILGLLLSLKQVFTSGDVWSLPAMEALIGFLPVLLLTFLGIYLGRFTRLRITAGRERID